MPKKKNMKDSRSFDKRSEDEQKEGYETVKTDLPSDRFSASKQVVKPDEMGVTSRSTPGNIDGSMMSAAKELRSKIKIKPDVSVDDLGGKQVGGVPLAVETGLRNAAGARTQSPADDTSRTPYSPGNYRPDTRYGKKRSEDLFELDNTATEQVVPIVDDLSDLRSAPDSTVGYNGRQQFKQTRQKKNFKYVNGSGQDVGKLPQQLLNDASVDLYEDNQVIYTCGQVVTPVNLDGSHGTIDPQADYPTTDGNNSLTGDDVMHKSNYMPTSLNITINNNRITAVSISELKFNADASSVVRDEANLNWQIDGNRVAKAMVRLQTELGRETTDKWSPLGYVIDQPYEYNMLMHDIEATTGAIMATAYRSAVSSLAFQRNISKKDGINPQRNAVKMILEGYAGILANNNRNTIGDLSFNHVLWNRGAYREGSVAALIAMFDSTGKYKTKADLLGLQRSFGLHLSQADNNINPLHCKPEFIRVLDKAHKFSTIDGSYNPFLPIYATKEIKLINPLSLNRFLVGWRNPALLTDEEKKDVRRDQTTGTYAQYMYRYTDLRNKYDTRVQHPIVEGLLRWLLKHEGAVVSTYGNGTINIPFVFDFQAPNMLSFMLCSAAQDVAFQRNICFRDVLFAGDQSTYIWDDLEELSKLNPLYSSQLKIGKYDEPLELGKLAPDTAIRLAYGDHKQLADETTSEVQYYEPWYFNEQGFDKTAGGSYRIRRGFFSDDTPFNFSFPSIRDGVRHEFVDLIRSTDPKDIMLSLDRKLDILPFTTATNITLSNGAHAYTEYTPMRDATTMGKISISALRYDPNSDGRIITQYDLDQGENLPLLTMGLYCIPKEIGFIDDAYFGYNVITAVNYQPPTRPDEEGIVLIAGEFTNFHNTASGASDVLYYNGGRASWLTSYRVEADSPSDGSIDRAAALTNTFYRFFASNEFIVQNTDFITATGIVPCRNVNSGLPVGVAGVYNLGSDNVSTHCIDYTVDTDAAYVWTLIQRFFLPMNPFANAATDTSTSHPHDPFEGSFFFGVCGFLAADYTQHVLERLSRYDQLGMDFTEDTNITTSLIFR